MAEKTIIQLGGREITLSNLDKVLWPESGYTKADLVNYMAKVAPYILPHLKDRPLTVTRYPDGIDGKFFYQKNCPEYAPDWIQTHPVPSKDGIINYILPQDEPTLVWLANQACIELHPALNTVYTDTRPNVVIIDLDPAEGATFADACEVALLVKEILDRLSLQSFPKTSGATGLHIYVPIEPKYTFEETSSWVGEIGAMLTRVYPEKVTNERLVRNRTGRVYVDHLQNLPGKTIVSVYSPRPKPQAPVSMPVHWEELPDIEPTSFTLATAPKRLEQLGDLFAPLLNTPQNLDNALATFAVR